MSGRKKKKAPYKIEVGPFTFTVQETADLPIENAVGVLDPLAHAIYVRPDLSAELAAVTKLHEYIHAVEASFGLEGLSEQTVDTLAAGLTQILLGRGFDPRDF